MLLILSQACKYEKSEGGEKSELDVLLLFRPGIARW